MNPDRCMIMVPPGLQCRNAPVDPDAQVAVCWRHLRHILAALETRGAVIKFDPRTLEQKDN